MGVKILLLRAAKAALRAIYAPMKLMRTRDRVTFISRQSDTPSVDFRLLQASLRERFPQYEIITLCRTIPKSPAGMISYALHILTQMKYIATSRVVVLDTYCIPVSVLRHKRDLRVLQLWHALGAFKRFGHSVAGEEEGSSLDIVQAMDMHKNYDLIVASGNASVLPFAEAFGYPAEKFLTTGLPRIDYISQERYYLPVREEIYRRYPMLQNGRQCILYVPTFRRSGGHNDYDLVDAVSAVRQATDLLSFNLIIKTHSGEELIYTESDCAEGRFFSGMELISVADHIISDYSSIIFEAGIANKPIYLYCYDRDRYVSSRGFYLDYDRDIPAVKSENIADIMDAIARGDCVSGEQYDGFMDRYVNRSLPCVSDTLAQIISELADGTYDGRYNYRP
ncbi:MAG: CDP-glycerol glycerophosphotransferase family protein [Clostridia bacterium]|nr:CDP-glycerol glycerophosphotransferase family protein [Clostridia bacterium]